MAESRAALINKPPEGVDERRKQLVPIGYTIKVEAIYGQKITERYGSSNTDEIYNQTVYDLNLRALVAVVNRMPIPASYTDMDAPGT